MSRKVKGFAWSMVVVSVEVVRRALTTYFCISGCCCPKVEIVSIGRSLWVSLPCVHMFVID